MANYWAIAIGINQYKHFQPLMYAQRDAQIFRDALVKDAAFPPKQCFLLTDAVPGINRTEATPTRDRIQACIAHTCRQRLYPGDVLWCFFSGYGVSVDGKEYLVPIEADPNSVATSGISMEWLFSTLTAASTRNIVLLLDVNRKQGMAGAMGEQAAHLAKASGIPMILSCRSDQVSSETLALRQGLFTTALLEAIRHQKCHTLEQFAQYLSDRLPELSEHHCRPPQHPVAVLPAEKRHQIMRPVMRSEMRSEMRLETADLVAAHAVHPSLEKEGASRSVQSSGGIPVYGYARMERNTSMAVPFAFSYDETTRFKPDPLAAVARKPSTLGEGDRTSNEAKPIPVGSIADLDSTRATQVQWSDFRFPQSVTSGGSVNLDQVNFAQVNRNPSQTANPNSIAAPIQSPAIESSLDNSLRDEQPEMSDRLFWRRVRTWGGILVATLLVGVIVRHGSNQPQNNAASLVPAPTQTDTSESTVAAPSQPAIQAEPGSPLETAYVAARSRRFQDAKFYLEQVPSHQRRADYQKVLDETNKGLLSDAKIALTRTRELTNENQASDFIEALETVRLIRPNEPHYAEAQEYVDRWSRVVFDMAQGRADRRNDSSSTVAADNYSTAIRTIRLIPEDAPVHERAQSALAHWSQRLFELAKDRAVEGKYDVAVYVAELIPADAPIYAEAQAAIESWRTQPTRFIAPTP